MRRGICAWFRCLPIVIGMSVILAAAESPDLPAALVRGIREGQVKIIDLTYALENLANLEQLPAAGAVLMTLPMKLRGGSGGPARVVAFVPVAAAGRR